MPDTHTEDPSLDHEDPELDNDHADVRSMHERNLRLLRDLRARRDNLNDAIREAVVAEELSRRALAIYDKATEGS